MKHPAVLSCFALAVSASAIAAPSLCAETTEQVVFSCQLRSGKIASVCASKDFKSEPATLQYRFGLPGKAHELQFPAIAADGPKAMSFTSYGAAKWESRNIRFEVGAYSYLLNSYSGVYEEPEATIVVRREGFSCRVLPCRRGFTDNMNSLHQLQMSEISRSELNRKCRPDGG